MAFQITVHKVLQLVLLPPHQETLDDFRVRFGNVHTAQPAFFLPVVFVIRPTVRQHMFPRL